MVIQQRAICFKDDWGNTTVLILETKAEINSIDFNLPPIGLCNVFRVFLVLNVLSSSQAVPLLKTTSWQGRYGEDHSSLVLRDFAYQAYVMHNPTDDDLLVLLVYG